MGGTDDPSNLVDLTVEEHAEAHRILYEQHGRKEDELAWKGLSGIIGKEQLLHELFVLAGKKSKHPGSSHKPNLGRKWSEEYKSNMSIRCKGIRKTQEHKSKISESKSRNWLIITPTGEKITIINLEKYCVASKTRKHHKGYVCERVL
jgi:hypothetical protein